MEWIKTVHSLPTTNEPLLAMVSDWPEPMVMAYVNIKEGGQDYKVWANCYGNIYGDPQYDDNYDVTHWAEIKLPQE